ncbi:MAG: LacI family DNA-binding transcriptional regulator [Spirochaetes bacterium]|nr:LacI family DNA-binding transcriptional regulator [Spirochaetota bacterium]
MANLKDIAKKANVSIRTVARVLNNHPHVAQTKRDEVKRAIAELGYTPNLLAQALRTKKTNMIGILAGNLSTEVTSKKIASLCVALNARGYRPVLGITYWQDERVQQFISDFNQVCDGIIAVQYDLSQVCADRISIPYISVDCGNAKVPSVMIDRSAGIREAFTKLASRYDRYVFLTPSVQPDEERRMAFTGSMKALKKDGTIITAPAEGASGGYAAGDAVAAAALGSALVFCYSDKTAVGLMKRLYELNIKIPGTIGVVGFDDDDYARHMYVSLSTVSQSVDTVALRAAEMIAARIDGKEVSGMTVPTTFVERASTGVSIPVL